MEYTLKTLTALGLICSAMSAVQAEEALKKEDVVVSVKESKRKRLSWSDARNGMNLYQIHSALNDSECHQFIGLIDNALERMFSQEIKKYQESLTKKDQQQKLPETQYVLGHLWHSAIEHLSEEEYKTLTSLVDIGTSRQYDISFSKKKKNLSQLPSISKSDRTLSKEEQTESIDQLKWMRGSIWLSVRPYLKEDEYEKFLNMIFVGFDRFITSHTEKEG